MSKESSPAFQCYAAEYLADVNTQLMTVEEEGCYWRLMLFCWREKSLPTDIASLTALCKGIAPSNRVLSCFTVLGDRLVHDRLERERLKQEEWRIKSAKGGRHSAHKPKSGKHKVHEQGGSTTVLAARYKGGSTKDSKNEQPYLQQLQNTKPGTVLMSHDNKEITPQQGGSTLQSSSSTSITNTPTPLSQTDQVVQAWNASKGVKPIRKLDSKRMVHLKARLEETDWPWKEALSKFPLPCFSNGKGWVPTFDWFIRPGTADKILEGLYDWTKAAEDRGPPSTRLATDEDKKNYNPSAMGK